MPQPDISRWLRYWLAARLGRLLSLCTPEVLTAELVERIVEVFATFPTWSAEQVYQHLRQQGAAVTLAKCARPAGKVAGNLRQTLAERYDLSRVAGCVCATPGWSAIVEPGPGLAGSPRRRNAPDPWKAKSPSAI